MPTIPDRQDLDGSNAARNTVGIFQAGLGALYDLVRSTLGAGASTSMQTKVIAQQTLGTGTRNKIINGNFAVNQRCVAGQVSLAPGQYGHDRWKAGDGGCTYTIGTDGVDTYLNILSGSLMQAVDALAVEAGVYTISWEGTSRLQLGDGGPGAMSPFITGPVPVGSSGFSIGLGPGTVGKVQIELGTAQTPFERRPFPIELALCQRYFSKSYRYATAPGTNTGIDFGIEDGPGSGVTFGNVLLTPRFPVPARIANPTVTIYDPQGTPNAVGIIVPGGTLANGQGAIVDSFSERGFKVFSQTANPQRMAFHWTQSSEL